MAGLEDRYAAVLYAAALFELSQESGELDLHLAQAANLRNRLEKEQLAGFLESPRVPDETKRELLEQRFGGQLAGDLMGFLYLSVEKGREALILPTLTAYLKMGDQQRGKAIAYVVSAKALRPEQIDALGALLSKKLGKRTEIVLREDASLIGGFTIHIDGRLIDRSVRSRLEGLFNSLKQRGPNDHKT